MKIDDIFDQIVKFSMLIKNVKKGVNFQKWPKRVKVWKMIEPARNFWR